MSCLKYYNILCDSLKGRVLIHSTETVVEPGKQTQCFQSLNNLVLDFLFHGKEGMIQVVRILLDQTDEILRSVLVVEFFIIIFTGYVNELFTQLQHCVSMELISRLSGRDMTKFDVIINRYPHPPFTFDHALEVMKFLLPMLIMLSFSYTAVNIVRAVTVEKELQLKVQL